MKSQIALIVVGLSLMIAPAKAAELEYIVDADGSPPSLDVVRAKAKDGWELVNVVPFVSNGKTALYLSYFKRGGRVSPSMGVNCYYERAYGSNGVKWFKEGPGPDDVAKWTNYECY